MSSKTEPKTLGTPQGRFRHTISWSFKATGHGYEIGCFEACIFLLNISIHSVRLHITPAIITKKTLVFHNHLLFILLLVIWSFLVTQLQKTSRYEANLPNAPRLQRRTSPARRGGVDRWAPPVPGFRLHRTPRSSLRCSPRHCWSSLPLNKSGGFGVLTLKETTCMKHVAPRNIETSKSLR